MFIVGLLAVLVTGSAGDTVELPSSNVFTTKQCKHGLLTWLSADVYIGKSLEAYGEWSEGEVFDATCLNVL